MHVHFPAIPTVPTRPGALKAHRDALLARLATCIKVLTRICEKAERRDEARRMVTSSVHLRQNGQNSDAYPNTKKRALRRVRRRSQ